MTVKELRELRAKLQPRMEELRDLAHTEGREWTAEDQANWEAINKEFDEYTRKIEIEERVARVGAELDMPVDNDPPGRGPIGRQDQERPITEQDKRMAILAWANHRSGRPVREEFTEAAERVGIDLGQKELKLDALDTTERNELAEAFCGPDTAAARRNAMKHLRESRTLSAVTGASGGYTVPEGFVRNLEVNMLAYGGMLQVSDVIRTNEGNDLPWPMVDDTSNTGELIAESGSIGSSVDPTFKQLVLKAYKYHSKPVLVPTELLEDSAFDLAAFVAEALGTRLGRISNTDFTTGTGAAKPKGVTIAASTAGVTTASATAITGDEVLELVHSVDPAYRTNARFMFHDNVLLAVRQLKNGMGQYIWQVDFSGGTPGRIAGFPYSINQDMASTVQASALTMLFGDFSKYKIRQVRGVRLVYMGERYADYDQVAWNAYMRQDGNLLDAGTAPIKNMTQHA